MGGGSGDQVGLKEASMPNFSFLGCLEVVVLWLETNKTTTTNLVKLEASLAPAEAEVGAEAKADQKFYIIFIFDLSLS